MFNLNVWASNPLERKNWIRGTLKKKERKKKNIKAPLCIIINTPRYSWHIAKVGVKHELINHIIINKCNNFSMRSNILSEE
jgi:hypothetical protein